MWKDKPTFDDVRKEHGPFIRRTLAQLGVHPGAMPAVEQEVFRAIARALPTFDEAPVDDLTAAVRGWLIGLCRHEVTSHHRSETRRAEVLCTHEAADEAKEDDAPHAEELRTAAQHRTVLEQLLTQIDPRRRAVVVAHSIKGVSLAEVAAALAIPLYTARNRHRLGINDLHAAGRRMRAKKGPQ